jgi:hypothetical protein
MNQATEAVQSQRDPGSSEVEITASTNIWLAICIKVKGN